MIMKTIIFIVNNQKKIMVRLQKIAYEQIVNVAALGRARTLTAPKKWNPVNHMDHTRKLIHTGLNSFLGRVFFKPIVQFIVNLERNIVREQNLQRGLSWEDTNLHHDSELRRNIFFEHVARQSLHPYHWILKARRRERFFKVDRGIRGFYVPEYVRNEAAQQTLAECQQLQKEWQTFQFDNYLSDLTPSARRTATPKVTLLQLLFNYGVMNPDAYNRYFFNERDHMWLDEKELRVVKDRKRFPFDLTNAEGKRRFEDYVNTINAKTPGVVAQEGQQFDFKKYYAEIGV